ncbi:SGNH hydrolase-type esterase domain-containing protein [Xylaria bambusicola]|uniref:SGNH hydrolase-type esterase domain-containing protein n=1 Tax=Xylaria bambusicola TaxID=326684 RepID=UPI0020080184|nr:SGNH hydrolase-type esterase domain-containing protein [Xylaria bambusicola]KAI0517050.1 SGNH hydrolase-type esterase domain-containing protein [Xylaria bambusicola]
MTTRIPLRLMPLGGSITYGVGSADGNGYRKLLYEALTSSSFDVTMLGSRRTGTMNNNSHEGWRGFKINEIQEKGVKSAKVHRPNLFTINGGSNDCIQGFDLGNSGKRIDDMLQRLWEASPGSTIILSTLLKNEDIQVNTRVMEFNHRIRQLVRQKEAEERKVVLADMDTPYGPEVGDLVDGVHPNNQGYKKMADIWYSSIQTAASRGFLWET